MTQAEQQFRVDFIEYCEENKIQVKDMDDNGVLVFVTPNWMVTHEGRKLINKLNDDLELARANNIMLASLEDVNKTELFNDTLFTIDMPKLHVIEGDVIVTPRKIPRNKRKGYHTNTY